jgi:RHS repeat-associated protein
VNGQSFCCDTKVLKSFDPGKNDNPELYQYYYHSDHLGSSSLITNLDGEIVQHVEYVPFGEVFIEERNNTWNTPYLFNAKELDEETGLYYYGARYYDARSSVWLSTDPLQEKYPNVSSYAYCVNNPVKFVDPDGKEKIIYYLIPSLDSYHSSMYPDDGAIHIFTHSSSRILGLEGFMGYNKVRVWGGSDLAFVLEQDSKTWKNRAEGEKLTIVIHGCNVANEESGISLAEKISASPEFKNYTIIAPDKKFIIGDVDGKFEYIGVYGDKTINGETIVNYEDKGNWVVFENGKKVKTIPGDQMPTSDKKKIDTNTNVSNFNYQPSWLPVTTNTNITNNDEN